MQSTSDYVQPSRITTKILDGSYAKYKRKIYTYGACQEWAKQGGNWEYNFDRIGNTKLGLAKLLF